MTFRDWWRKHSESINSENMYEWFERCWEYADNSAVAGLVSIDQWYRAVLHARIDLARIDDNKSELNELRSELNGWIKHFEFLRDSLDKTKHNGY